MASRAFATGISWLGGGEPAPERSAETAQPLNYAIKTAIRDPGARHYRFNRQKTMYGGKQVAAGDTIYLFASENEGGTGLIARGVVTAASAVARIAGVERQTPRVSIQVRRTATARRPLGREDLKGFRDWKDGRPETELNFKYYRQATNKIVAISDEAAAFLERCFSSRPTAARRRSRATRRASVPPR